MATNALKNVLLLIADDLRPNLNVSYDQPYMHTPALDQFTGTALTFDRAYTNFAICSASRNSFLSGRVPDKTRVWNFINFFRQSGLSADGSTGADWLSLPELFKAHGYVVLGHGKTYHPNKPPNNDEPRSWSQEQPYVPLTSTGCPKSPDGHQLRFCPDVGKKGSTDQSDFSDYNTTMSALTTLRAYANGSKPFFIALGLHFPHQSWATPAWAVQKYDATTLAAAVHTDAPAGAPDIAFTAELDGDDTLALDESNPLLSPSAPAAARGGVRTFACPRPGNNTVPLWAQRQLRQGYYSAVTHSDWLLGKMIDELTSLGRADDTLVVVTADHGWQLGEHAEWGKHTNWELALQVPLLIRAPWLPASMGKHTGSYFELIDLYRTVASLAGIDPAAIAADVDGSDASKLLADPATTLKTEAYSQYSRCPGDRFWPKRQPGVAAYVWNNCEEVPAPNITSMGYSVRTPDWRLTEWFAWDGASCAARFDRTIGIELYDHRSDPPALDFDASENANVAAAPEHAAIVATLKQKLRKRFDTGAALGCPPDPVAPHNVAAVEES
jgi:iduronate 2-sulfatase